MKEEPEYWQQKRQANAAFAPIRGRFVEQAMRQVANLDPALAAGGAKVIRDMLDWMDQDDQALYLTYQQRKAAEEKLKPRQLST